MASPFCFNIGITMPQLIKSDGTSNMTVGDIQEEINAQFEVEVRTFMEINRSGSQRIKSPQTECNMIL
jgi:hypothetical protein